MKVKGKRKGGCRRKSTVLNFNCAKKRGGGEGGNIKNCSRKTMNLVYVMEHDL